ncbi:MFS transporter [Saccharothrix violaceirubra]|uniref:MFS family permease n=1 Tax=Saccharothrix violaceirubra TaxID=413306 RepID=A0A7W7T9E1_9PSEU|nr:MFS transporter [Saccharothrix violaceirubra]MBB4968991.1 MFS family permease [Saccharothrix violaceirubra]
MNASPYLAVLRTPRLPSMLALMLVARVPATAAGMTITMHVLLGLNRGYGEAGLVGALSTAGIGLGAPLLGRLVDRRGLRTMLLVTTLGETAFWFISPELPYPALVVAAFVGGLLVIPMMSLGRQVLTALAGPDLRRPALALDSMAVELAFMAGPACGVFLTTHWSSRTAMWAIGGSLAVLAVLLYAVNPPVRGEDEPAAGTPSGRRWAWIDGRVLGTLLTASAATFTMSGFEVSLVASMRGLGLTDWTGALIIVSCLASLVGGFVYGGLRSAPPAWVLMAGLGALTVPLGLVGDMPWVLALALVPASALCAPAIAATGEAITTLAPVEVRGEAMGLQGSAFTLGAALGQPAAGFAIDHTGPAWGYAVAGSGGVVIALLGALLSRRQPTSVR